MGLTDNREQRKQTGQQTSSEQVYLETNVDLAIRLLHSAARSSDNRLNLPQTD